MLASVHRAAVVLPYRADFSRPACLSLPPAGLISAYLNIDNTESLQPVSFLCVIRLSLHSFLFSPHFLRTPLKPPTDTVVFPRRLLLFPLTCLNAEIISFRWAKLII